MSGELDFIGDFFGAIFGDSSRSRRRSRRNEYSNEQTIQRNNGLQRQLNSQQQYIDSLSSNIRNIESNHIQRINNMKGAFNNKLDSQARKHSKEIRNVRSELKNDIQNLSHELQSQIGALQNIEMKSAELAHQWADDTRKLLDFIGQNYKHNKFMPGQLNQLISKMNTGVVSNIKSGIYQAAVSGAQNIFLDAQQLRLELELKETEWSTLYESIEIDVKDFIDNCENSKSVGFEFETSQGCQKLEVDVEHWSRGNLGNLLKELHQKQENLKRLKENYSLEDLEDLHKNVSEYEEKIEKVVDKARNAVFASQVRGDIAKELASKFELKGWRLKEAVYEQNDQRNPLHIKFAMGDDEVVIKYSPEETEESVRNSINVAFFDRTRNDELSRQERMADIIETTQNLGIDCSDPVCKAGTEDKPCQDETKLDFESLTQVQK